MRMAMYDILASIVSGVSEGLVTVKHVSLLLLDINHLIMTKVLTFLVCVCETVWAGLNVLCVTVYTILVCMLDFCKELLNFTQAVLYLLWKLVLLVINLLDLLFHVLESVLYFLWTGGKWTAVTITKSAQTLSENGVGTWNYFVISIKEFADSIIGGFTVIGQLAKSSTYFFYESFSWMFASFDDILHYADSKIRQFCLNCYESFTHFTRHYVLGLSRDTYLGILICITTYIILSNIFRKLCSRGLTFPFFHSYSIHHDDDASDIYYDDYDGRMAEFSDDDYVDLSRDDSHSDNDDDYIISDGDTVEDSDDEISDVESELEVDSSDESAVSGSEIDEINIQLPKTDDNYDNRRSATPSRLSKDMTTRDLQRLIEDEKERRKCVVCQDFNKSVLILPCKHMCLCVRCANQIARSRVRERRVCPLCRRNIETIMDVYV